MVYTSLPVYLDPPNWNQQQQQQVVQPQQPPPLLQGAGNHLNNNTLARDASNNNRHLPQQVPPPQHVDGVAVAGAGTVRTNSMADRARLAKIPQPEQALKCPRCDSTNTKFCYFNNYSLSQPRHFCKTCRRYWTRGGALRNVPVGGGCRRNKRSKSGGSKAASGTDTKAGPSCSATTGTGSVGVSGAIGANSLTASLQLPFLPSLHPLADYGSTNLGFNYCRIPTVDPVDYPAVTSSGIALEPWRLQQVHQLPFFAGIEPTTNVAQPPTSIPFYAFDEEATGPAEPSPATLVGQPQGKPPVHGLTITQLPQVKLEPNSQGINLETQHVRIHANDQYWREGGGGASSATGSVGGGGGGNGWTDLSGFSSTSTGVLL